MKRVFQKIPLMEFYNIVHDSGEGKEKCRGSVRYYLPKCLRKTRKVGPPLHAVTDPETAWSWNSHQPRDLRDHREHIKPVHKVDWVGYGIGCRVERVWWGGVGRAAPTPRSLFRVALVVSSCTSVEQPLHHAQTPVTPSTVLSDLAPLFRGKGVYVGLAETVTIFN